MVLSSSLRLHFAPENGYHYVADQRITKGTTILHELPIAWSISDSRWKFTCRHCLSTLVQSASALCPACNRAIFCKKCRKHGVRLHVESGECALLSDSTAAKSLGDFIKEVCLALRLRIALIKNPQEPPLQSNASELLQSRWTDPEDKSLFLLGVRSIIASCLTGSSKPECTHEEASHALGQVLTCGVELAPALTGHGEEVRGAPSVFGERPSGIYMNFSRINHSCRPNAAYYTAQPKCIVVRSLCPISQGEELCVAYTDLLQPRHLRRQILQQSFCFQCSCPRCSVEEAQKREFFLTAVGWNPGSEFWACRGTEDDDSRLVCMEPSKPHVVHHSKKTLQESFCRHVCESEDLIVQLAHHCKHANMMTISGDVQEIEEKLLKAITSGVHLLHHACLKIYSKLSLVGQVERYGEDYGRTGSHFWKSILYALAHSWTVDYSVVQGEYGLVLNSTSSWIKVAELLCKSLTYIFSEAHDAYSQRKVKTTASDIKTNINTVGNSGLVNIQNQINSPRRLGDEHYSQLTPAFILGIRNLVCELSILQKAAGDWGAIEQYLENYLLTACHLDSYPEMKPSKCTEILQNAINKVHCPKGRKGMLVICESIALVLARTQNYLQTYCGPFHSAHETVAFVPYSSWIPSSVASAICQATFSLRHADDDS